MKNLNPCSSFCCRVLVCGVHVRLAAGKVQFGARTVALRLGEDAPEGQVNAGAAVVVFLRHLVLRSTRGGHHCVAFQTNGAFDHS